MTVHQPELIPDQPSPKRAARDAERAEYLERLREKLKDPGFRAIEGFPIGEDEDILALSDPPYYAACPNPFLPEIIERWQAERAKVREELGLPDDSDDNGNSGEPVYHREPFAADVSEGKNDPIYNAHTYHTKVPYKAIMRYILHYTDPGDVVLDGFCGTGMTGVAAQLCGDHSAIEQLGYQVLDEGIILRDRGEPTSRLGARFAVVSDLAPIATFIAHNLNYPLPPRYTQALLGQLQSKLASLEEDLYLSFGKDGRPNGVLNYVVWSDVYVCKQCLREYIYWEAAVDLSEGIARKRFPCPHCDAEQSTRNLERAYQTDLDPVLKKPIRLFKQVPVYVSYLTDGSRHRRVWNEFDESYLRNVELSSTAENTFPVMPLPRGDRWRRDAFEDKGVTHLHHFYTLRSVEALSRILDAIKTGSFSHQERSRLLFLFTSFADRNATKRNRFVINKYNPQGRVNGPMANTLYLPSLFCEMNVLRLMKAKSRDIVAASGASECLNRGVVVSTGSSNVLDFLDSNSVDYIFTDPPFGHNIQYAELNLGLESFLGVQTAGDHDIVVNLVAGKPPAVYTEMMYNVFKEYYRVLKPGRWMTVEFHNSRSSVWHAIQEALGRSGFVIAHVATLDKRHRTVHQDTNIGGTVNQDLIISTYKPRARFERRFLAQAGGSEGAWAFVRQHLEQLPVVVATDGALEVVAERQAYLLYDRMVAFHIQRGFSVPLGAAEFYAGLKQRFPERDGMYFLPDQVPEYDRARLQAAEVAQLTLFVSDEKSTIQWLRQQLDSATGGQPQTYQELQPQFLRQLHQARHEVLPELSEMLEQNFLQDETGRWYVPDPSRASDLEKLRRKALLREFAGYAEDRGKLRKFRTEAIRAGFADGWHRRDYGTIVKVAERLPERVLQEDPDLLMYYDNATLRVEE